MALTSILRPAAATGGALLTPHILSRVGDPPGIVYGDLSVDNGPALQAALEAGHSEVVIRSPIAVSQVYAQPINALRLVLDGYGDMITLHGTDIYTGSAVIWIDSPHNVTIEGSGWINADNRSPGGIAVDVPNSVLATDTPPRFSMNVGVRNMRRRASVPGQAYGIRLRGHCSPSLNASRAHDISREAGAGINGSQGCAGMVVTQKNNLYPKIAGQLWTPGCEVYRVSCDDVGVDNTDCDGIMAFTGSNVDNGMTIVPTSEVAGRGGDFRDIQGRCVKTQASSVDISGLRGHFRDCTQIDGGWRLLGLQTTPRVRLRNIAFFFDGTLNQDITRSTNSAAGDPNALGANGIVVNMYDTVDRQRPVDDLLIDGLEVTGKNLSASPGFLALIAVGGDVGASTQRAQTVITNLHERGVPHKNTVNGPFYTPTDGAVSNVTVESLAETFWHTNQDLNGDARLRIENLTNLGTSQLVTRDGKSRSNVEGVNVFGLTAVPERSARPVDTYYSGDRTSFITPSISGGLSSYAGTSPLSLVNGSTETNTANSWAFGASVAVAGARITFQLDRPTALGVIQMVCSGTYTDHGKWKAIGSDDGVTWYDLSIARTWEGDLTKWTISDASWRMTHIGIEGVSGNCAVQPWITEMRLGPLPALESVRHYEVLERDFDRSDDPTALAPTAASAVGVATEFGFNVGDTFGYVTENGASLSWRLSRTESGALTALRISGGETAAQVDDGVADRLSAVESLAREDVSIRYQPGNAHRFVWIEVDGYRYRFEYLVGSRAVSPLSAPTGSVLLLHDGEAIDYAPSIMRHARAGQLFRETGGRLYEYKGGMTTVEEYGTPPSGDRAEQWFRLDAR